MPPTQIAVTYGANGLASPDGVPPAGTISIQPIQEVPGATYTLVSRPVVFHIANATIAGVMDTNGVAFQALVYEDVTGAKNPPPYVVQVPASGTLDLSVADRGTIAPANPLYILASARGVPGGVATLDPITGFVTAGQLPPDAASMHPWDVAKAFGGLSDPDAVEDFFNDPNNPFVGAANTTYTNKRIICSSLTDANNFCEFDNCEIVCMNDNFGVRVDANTGFEVGRRFRHCKLTCTGAAFAGAGFTATLCEVVGNGDDFVRAGRSYAEPTVLELCYVHGFRPAVGAHADGIQQLTWPAAGTRAWGCWIEMLTDPAFTIDPTSGYTAAGFFDPTDVPISADDPFPLWIGLFEMDACRLVSEDNYTIVADETGMDVSNCMLLPGTTAIASIPSGVVVTGQNNIGADGNPIASLDIAGASQARTVLGQLQDVDLLTSGPADGDTLVYSATTKQWTPGSGGGGFTPLIRPQYITDGDIQLTANTGGAWQIATRVDGTTRIELDLPASVGHWVEIDINGMRTGAAAVDVAVVVGSSQVRYLATGTATPAGDGDTGWYASGGTFFLHGGTRGFTVTSGDLDGGNVRFCLVFKSTGTGAINASTGDTFYWQAKNLGPHS